MHMLPGTQGRHSIGYIPVGFDAQKNTVSLMEMAKWRKVRALNATMRRVHGDPCRCGACHSCPFWHARMFQWSFNWPR